MPQRRLRSAALAKATMPARERLSGPKTTPHTPVHTRDAPGRDPRPDDHAGRAGRPLARVARWHVAGHEDIRTRPSAPAAPPR